MQREEINILIVDDDATLGKAIHEALTRAGFKALHVMKPDEAISTLKLQPFHGAIVDCMLPKMNGRQLAKLIHADWPEMPIIMMSGIYKDKNFARDAMAETGAVEYLTKPFDLSHLIQTIENKLDSKIDAPLAPMQSAYTKEALSYKERVKAINDAEEVHGYELPWVISLLMFPRVNGHLNIITSEGDVCGIGFQNGNIVQVQTNDTKSYFGVLMVEYGFISQTEIDEVMKSSGKTKKMGERLVEANVLSPHAIQIVMVEQQGIRLSKVILGGGVKVNFIESDEVREDAKIDRHGYTELLNEWLQSKIPIDWLKGSYLPWMRYNMKQNSSDQKDIQRVYAIPILQRLPNFHQYLLSKQTLEQAIADSPYPEEHFYPALHALMVSRVIRFGDQVAIVDTGSQKKRLSRLITELEKQNYFDRLHVIPKVKDADLKRSYHELAKILHPDKLPKDTPAEIRDLTRKCFELINQAYETISDPSRKENYLLELEKGKASAIMEAETLLEGVRPLLTKGDFKKAKEMLEQVHKLAPPTAEAKLLYMWARMKTTPEGSAAAVAAKVKEELLAIAPEDRHTSIFYFTRGLNLRLTGDLDGSKKNLEHAISIDADFIDAKRELVVLNASKTASSSGSSDLLRGDLKDVVGLLFKKKK